MILIIAIIINIMIAIVTVNVGITGIIIVTMKTFFFFLRCYYDVDVYAVSIGRNCFLYFFMFEKAPSKFFSFRFLV